MTQSGGTDYFDPPTPAVLIAPSRSGGTFLCHCLDSHYQIGCERDEPFNPARYWQKLGLANDLLMRALWRRAGYRVAMFKLSYRHLKGLDCWNVFREVKPRVIHLWRQNALATLVSAKLNTLATAGLLTHPVHTYRPVKPRRLELDCPTLLSDLRHYIDQVGVMRATLMEFEPLELTYEQITGGQVSASRLPKAAAAAICEYLGVTYGVMGAELVRLNAGPLCETVTNWPAVVDTLKGTDYEWMTN